METHFEAEERKRREYDMDQSLTIARLHVEIQGLNASNARMSNVIKYVQTYLSGEPVNEDMLMDSFRNAQGDFESASKWLAGWVNALTKANEELSLKLAELTVMPDVPEWEALIRVAYADKGDGCLRINRITAEYNRVRTKLDSARKAISRIREALGVAIMGSPGPKINWNDEIAALDTARKQLL